MTIRHHVASQTNVKAIRFMTCGLIPPPKRLVLEYLGIPLVPEENGQKKNIDVVRKAESDVSLKFPNIEFGFSFSFLVTSSSISSKGTYSSFGPVLQE